MTTPDKVLFTGFALGILLMLCSVLVTNLALQRMRGVLNRDRAPQNQLRWHDAVQVVAQRVIDAYRASYPEGPLYRNLIVGYFMFGIGVAVMFIGMGLALLSN
jgi:hypothetical protein